MSRALVLFSGGKDSTVALAWARRNHEEVTGLSFDVPYRPGGERDAAAAIAAALEVSLRTVALPFISDVATMTRGSKPQQTAEAYVPHRNLIFHSIACHLAIGLRCDHVVAGHIPSDGVAYKDASAGYLNSIYDLVEQAAGDDSSFLPDSISVGAVELQLPLAGMSDREVIELGRDLNAPLHLSWSCLEDGSGPCGQCVSCRDRAEALALP